MADTTALDEFSVRLARIEKVLGLQRLGGGDSDALPAGGNSAQSNHCASNYSVNCAQREMQALE